MTDKRPRRHDRSMDLPAPLAWLVDEAGGLPGPDRFLAELGERCVTHGLPLAGGALTLAVPHPIVVRRTWLWRAETGMVIEALGFADGTLSQSERDWLAGLGPVQEDTVGPTPDSPVLGWAGTRAFDPVEAGRLRQIARFVSAPLAALTARAALSALFEAYLGRRSAARVQAGALRRGSGETIRAVLLCADLRDFTALSEATEPATMIAALDAWFDRVAGAVHAFGGEVLKFIGDGVLAIFRSSAPRRRPARRRCVRLSRPAPAWPSSTWCGKRRAYRHCRSARRCISARYCGAISAQSIGWT